ncbi:phenylacetate-CoA oxygenase subunit PaaJ [Putridiphycobacter roseus]|uniref:Phenylacetate-CoA oxygenase subunit PaaJ n=1 Tax=Putridiphycobacter roseus TaxID=2219161 RepID=A0A2W1NFF7_9FLAO|nr:1,2-phenylacetyl-CoA epoxidase subunit PaaD [Putridiphycobacter roseus]PZE17833.1 phenylacetate-CoA oxygenase subunit PaaJ [Putridiphycobacter roseus]
MVSTNLNEKEIWGWMTEVPDPEIPIINLVELGVIRAVNLKGNAVEIIITPTYTGCPAKQLFVDLISEKLVEKGINDFEVISRIHPVWTTDWLSEETKAKLLKDGISPPTVHNKKIICPHCKSYNTVLASQFGSTPCQSLYKCLECLEPFNYFKCL